MEEPPASGGPTPWRIPVGFLPCLNPSRGREAEGQRAGEQPSRTAAPGLTGLAQPCVPMSLLDPVSLLIPMPCPGSGGGPSTAPLPRGPPAPRITRAVGAAGAAEPRRARQ